MADKPRVRNMRTRPRIEKTETMSKVTKPARHRGNTAGGKSGVKKLYHTPEGAVYEITGQASELVPVAQYASVTIGPVAIKRTIIVRDEDTLSKEHLQEVLAQALKDIQDVCETVVAEDRQLVLDSVAAHNEREAEKAKQESKKRS